MVIGCENDHTHHRRRHRRGAGIVACAVAVSTFSACGLSVIDRVSGLAPDTSSDANGNGNGNGDAVASQTDGLGANEGDGGGASDALLDVEIDDAASTDAKSDADAAKVDAGAGVGFCKEPGIVACYRFENNIVDESTPAIGAPTLLTNVGYSGGIAGQAIHLTPTSVVHLPDDATWDVTNATVEMWVNVKTRPAAGVRAGLFDNGRRYAVFVQPNGVARCGTANLDSTVLPLNTWTHLACVWDASATTVKVYVNGTMTATAISTEMPVSGTSEAAIGGNIPSGDPLDGLIDSLRIFNVARTTAQIAAAAAVQQ